MKTQPITPAAIAWDGADGVPRSTLYGNRYHPATGALQQARDVFLAGNGLPGRWAGRSSFVVLETAFGLGHNFIATWAAWRADAARCQRLVYVAIDRHPPTRADLTRAHAASPLPEQAAQLLQAWPPLTPNLHAIDLEDGRVRLLLAFGDIAALLPQLRAEADAFYLDGFAPARNPAMWQLPVLQALGRHAAPGATLATWSAAADLRAGLVSAGFEVKLAPGLGGQGEITLAHHAPRHTPRQPPRLAVAATNALVVGAGIAGAAAARALARAGLSVTVLDRQPQPAAETSGNPAGLFHGTVNADDGPYARLFRAAALHAQRCYGPAIASGAVAGSTAGLLRLHGADVALTDLRQLLQAQALPPDYVQALAATEASAHAGVHVAAPAWFYPGAGWLAPTDWVQLALATPGVHFVGGCDVQGLAREGSDWVLRDAAGRTLAAAPLVVLAHAAQAAELLRPLGHGGWPLRHTRGQVTHWPGASPLRMALAGDGYALPLPGGLLCGATREAGVPGAADALALRDADHAHNLQRLQRLTGLQQPADGPPWQGRAGWRLHTDDRLPLAGALPLVQMPQGQRLDQPRLLPREAGLFVLTALGARGITLAPLLGELVAAMATGMPWPLEQDLADAVDPGRWQVRAARAAGRTG